MHIISPGMGGAKSNGKRVEELVTQTPPSLEPAMRN
jgi:hypothetical protein